MGLTSSRHLGDIPGEVTEGPGASRLCFGQQNKVVNEEAGGGP